MDEYRTYLVNLPTRVPGLLAVDEDGEPSIYLNARLTRVQHKRTYDHEVRHIQNDDAHNDDPVEVAEARASLKKADHESRRRVRRPRPYLELSDNLREEAKELFGLSTRDRRWSEIHWALTVTSLQAKGHSRKRAELHRTFYYPPVKIRLGRMYKGPSRLPDFCRHEQSRILGMPSYWHY